MPEGEPNYVSGDDYVLEFLGYRYAFGADDFRSASWRAAVKLGSDRANDLDEDEMLDLVELAADGRIAEPRSALGHYLIRHWERLSLNDGESLVYWLRKLVFRGAYLDHRVKEGLLEVTFDEDDRRFRLCRARGRPRAARARSDAELARAAVPALTASVGSGWDEKPSRCSSSATPIRISLIAPSGTISSSGSPSSQWGHSVTNPKPGSAESEASRWSDPSASSTLTPACSSPCSVRKPSIRRGSASTSSSSGPAIPGVQSSGIRRGSRRP